MNRVKKLESLTEVWLRPLPHLPNGFRKLLADNAWWLVVLAAFTSAIAVLVNINNLFSYVSYISNAQSYAGFYISPPSPTSWLFTALLGLVYFSIVTVLFSKAATLIRENMRQGWDVLFMVLVVGAANVLLGAVFSFNFYNFVFGVIFGIIVLTIAAYFLFEIRSYFVKVGRVKPVKK